MVSDQAEQPGETISSIPRPLVAISLAFGAFGILVVNFWIYRARINFSATHPEYVKVDPPTISRAISDPLIGDPFAIWISLSAVALIIAMAMVSRMHYLSGVDVGPHSPGTGRVLKIGAVVLFLLQLSASAGMVVLSNFRFPNFNDVHMSGSYLFFFSQAILVLLGTYLSARVIADPVAVNLLNTRDLLQPRLCRYRVLLGKISVGLGLLFLSLFILKDVDLKYGVDAIYAAYVVSEPSLITSFLIWGSLYMIDGYLLLRAARSA